MEKINKNNKIIFILLSLGLICPSLVFILSGRKIIDLVSSFTFFFTKPTIAFTPAKIIGTLFFVGLFIAISIFYYKILKNHKKEFVSTKKVAIFIIIVSLIFCMMLPLTSTDVFYYIATGWSEVNYRSKSILYICKRCYRTKSQCCRR